MTTPTEDRDAVYKRFFGNNCTASHELLPLDPHIDVYTYKPRFLKRRFYTLVTSGMSDKPMAVPEGFSYRRVELILYVREPTDTCIRLLRYLAHIPHDQQTWFSAGGTMTNGVPPRPIFPNSALDCFLFLFPVVKPDCTLQEHLRIDGDDVRFMWVVPVSSEECEFVRSQGVAKLMAIFGKRNHPVVLDEMRDSYI